MEAHVPHSSLLPLTDPKGVMRAGNTVPCSAKELSMEASKKRTPDSPAKPKNKKTLSACY